jgi:Zn-finger nucleic acid-binding protein
VCDTCAAELKRARERTRSCPIDGTKLSKEIVLNVVIDHCPRCGGVWLDAGELRLLIEGRRLQGFLDGFADSLDVS